MGNSLSHEDTELIAVHLADCYKKHLLLLIGTIFFTTYMIYYLCESVLNLHG